MDLVIGTLMEVLLLLSAIFLVAIIVFRHHRLNKNALITNWPILGMLPGLFCNVPRLHDFVTEILSKSRGTFEFKSFYFSNTDFLVTCDPLNIQHILGTNFANYPKGPEFRDIFEALGDGILSVDSDLWRLQRKMFQLWNARQSKTGFVSEVIHGRVVNDLIPFLDHVSQTGNQVDLEDAFRNMVTFDNAISLTFGPNFADSHDFRSSKAQHQKAFGDIQETMLRRHFIPSSLWKLQRWLQIGGERNHKTGWECFDRFLSECVSLKRRESERSGKSSADMISVYLEDNESPYSDKFLKDVAMNLATAARETFTSTLTWFFWLVVTHPQVEAKILREIEDKLDDHDIFGAEELSKLVYLQAALQETLRLYPSLPFNHKTASEEDTLPSGHRVKPKQRVLLSFYSTGRMREVWGEDCLEFKPERWIDSETKDRLIYVPPHKFPTFNLGARTCLGKDMVFIQAKVVAINVLRKFRLQVVQGHQISPTITISIHMKRGLMVNVRRRF